jgi:mannitol/fructose-specific phosphotransferase system IIA component (Ntr-type)
MGIAIPHVKIASVRDFVMAVGLSAEGVDFESLDRSPTRIVVMIACNNSQAADFLKVLSKVAGGLRTPAAQEKLLLAPTPADVVAALCGPGGLLA